MVDATLQQRLADYRARWPDEAGLAEQFAQLLDDATNPFLRERVEGHFTGSAWVVSADGTRTLLTHHRKLQRWLQLGGHADGDRDLAQVALREAQEESGLTGLCLADAAIFDWTGTGFPRAARWPGTGITTRYVVMAGADEAFEVSEESLALAWRPVAELLADPQLDPSMRRMAEKWVARAR